MSWFKGCRLPLLALLLFCVPLAQLCAGEGAPKVYVILWFDTEDYLSPNADNVTLRLAQFLTRELVKAVFKVVGERALSMERRGRTDVIEALKKHEIGFHSRWHSVQPTPALYMSTCGWDEGVEEFDRREKPGYDDVQRIFGQAPSCYGQPGSSWGPQSYGAMRKWGMPVYLDEAQQVGLNRKPFYYGGALNLFHLEYRPRADLRASDKYESAEDRFLEMRKKIQKEGGGIISIYYHPTEWATNQFWDGANFTNGANPPREEWKLPKQKTAEETKVAFEIFEKYVRFMKHFEDVEFINARDAVKIWHDRSKERTYAPAEIRKIAEAAATEKLIFQTNGDYTLSVADQLVLLNQSLLAGAKKGEPISLKLAPFGPGSAAPELKPGTTTDPSQFRRTAEDVQDTIVKMDRVPSAVWLGSTPISPESYLRTLAEMVVLQEDGKDLPAKIEIKPAKLASAEYVSADNPKLWGWVIFPPNCSAPEMMTLAKRQAWTLKPAILDREVVVTKK